MQQFSLPMTNYGGDDDISSFAISPMLEIGAYEELWAQRGTTFKRIADRFRNRPWALPSHFVDRERAQEMSKRVIDIIRSRGVDRFGVRVRMAAEYPLRLRNAKNPIELLYYRGWWDLVETKCVAIVGSRRASDLGKRRAAKIASMLVKDGFTIVSGLARGIDTVAHTTAIRENGNTIAVIGTPIHEYYPKENRKLQDFIAEHHLLISQVPVYRYSQQDYRSNRVFFPERNKTMSALTEATVIIEASDTSGTLIQARAAMYQGRKLFILDSCFRNRNITWPERFEKKGAVRVRDYDDIRSALIAR